MSTQPTTQDRIFRAQSAARLEMLRRMRRYTVDDIVHLENVLDQVRDREQRLIQEIQQEERQWKEDQ